MSWLDDLKNWWRVYTPTCPGGYTPTDGATELDRTHPIAELRAGDHVMLCFNEAMTPEEATQVCASLNTLETRTPGVTFGAIVGVSGVLIQRKDAAS